MRIIKFIKYLIIYRKLKYSIDLDKKEFYNLLKLKTYNNVSNNINRNKYDFLLQCNISEEKGLLEFYTNPLLLYWRSTANFKGNISIISENKCELIIICKYNLIVEILVLLFSCFLVSITSFYGIFIVALLCYMIINYEFQVDVYKTDKAIKKIFQNVLLKHQ